MPASPRISLLKMPSNMRTDSRDAARDTFKHERRHDTPVGRNLCSCADSTQLTHEESVGTVEWRRHGASPR